MPRGTSRLFLNPANPPGEMQQWAMTGRHAMHYAQITMESGGKQGRTREDTGTVYRIMVRDELSERFAAAFEGMEIETRGGQTVLTGEIIDQPRLHSILDRIGALGLKLVSVEAISQETRTR